MAERGGFIQDVVDWTMEGDYECLRCGYAPEHRAELYEHREGVLSRCRRRILRSILPW